MKISTKTFIHSVEDKETKIGPVLEIVFKMSWGYGEDRFTFFSKGSAWNKTRERLIQSVSKGQKVYVWGRVRDGRIFQRQDGSNGLGMSFTIEDLEVLADGETQFNQERIPSGNTRNNWGNGGYETQEKWGNQGGQNNQSNDWGNHRNNGNDGVPF